MPAWIVYDVGHYLSNSIIFFFYLYSKRMVSMSQCNRWQMMMQKICHIKIEKWKYNFVVSFHCLNSPLKVFMVDCNCDSREPWRFQSNCDSILELKVKVRVSFSLKIYFGDESWSHILAQLNTKWSNGMTKWTFDADL